MERHNRPIIVLVTVCVKDRRPLLANAQMFGLLQTVWREKAVAWKAGRFVLMPDHVHVFCTPADFPGRPVKDWVGFWKRQISLELGQSIWQQNFWDRQLRDGEHYGQRWDYVRQNPVRAGLAVSPEDWPWQGEVSVLPW